MGSYIFNINFINFVQYNYHLKIIYMPEYLYLIWIEYNYHLKIIYAW